MKMVNESRKVAQTKSKIKDAFLELYAKKKIEKISIKEITDLAGLNRGTFYVYFLDIYDLQDQVEEDFFDVMREKAGKVLDAIFEGKDFMKDLPDTKFYIEHKKYFDVLFNENNTDARLVKRVKEIARTFVYNKLGERQFKANENLEYVLEYMIGAHISVITYWLRQGMEIPLESVAALLKDISVMGPAAFFKAR